MGGFTVAELEASERDAAQDFWAAAPGPVRAGFGVEQRRLGEAALLLAPDLTAAWSSTGWWAGGSARGRARPTSMPQSMRSGRQGYGPGRSRSRREWAIPRPSRRAGWCRTRAPGCGLHGRRRRRRRSSRTWWSGPWGRCRRRSSARRWCGRSGCRRRWCRGRRRWSAATGGGVSSPGRVTSRSGPGRCASGAGSAGSGSAARSGRRGAAAGRAGCWRRGSWRGRRGVPRLRHRDRQAAAGRGRAVVPQHRAGRVSAGLRAPEPLASLLSPGRRCAKSGPARREHGGSGDDERTATARRFILALPHARDLGMDIVEVGDGMGADGARLRRALRRRSGDRGAARRRGDGAARHLLGGGGDAASAIGRGRTATIDLRIDYMRAAQPERRLHARAECYRVTRTVAFVRAPPGPSRRTSRWRRRRAPSPSSRGRHDPAAARAGAGGQAAPRRGARAHGRRRCPTCGTSEWPSSGAATS